MAKLHIRLSVELEVTEEQLKRVINASRFEHAGRTVIGDLDVSDIQQLIDVRKAIPCDWDDGGYIPANWLVYDAVEAGVMTVEEAERGGADV